MGKRYGNLTYDGGTHKVSDRLPGAKGYESRWRCDCGKTVVVRDRDVVNGATKSCGCRRKRSGKDSVHFTGYEEITGAFWNSIQCNARHRGKSIEVTLPEVWEKFLTQDRRCAFTDTLLTFETGSGKHDGTASLDRIDSSKGYTRDNVQWVHKDINYIKRDLSDADFIALCKKVAAHRA